MAQIRKILILIGLIFCLAVTTSLAAEKAVSDFSRPILVTPADPVVIIRLPANPSTGYQWVLTQYDHKLLEPLKSEYEPSAKDLIGAPGYSILKFKLKKNAFIVPQHTTVILQYKRPWEKNGDFKQQIIQITTQSQ